MKFKFNFFYNSTENNTFIVFNTKVYSRTNMADRQRKKQPNLSQAHNT